MSTVAFIRSSNRALVAPLALALVLPLSAAPAADRELKADEGVVIVSITGNTREVGQFSAVHLRPVKGPNAPERRGSRTLGNVAAGVARDTALFIGYVPAGEYELDRFEAPPKILDIGDGARELLGHLRVEAGKVADLGRIVVTPVNERVLTGRSALVTSNASLVRRFSPENARELARTTVAGWIAPRSPVDRVEEYALDRPVGADDVQELPTGEVVAASRLGTIFVKGNDGFWRLARTGKLESLLSIALVPRGELDGDETWLAGAGEFDTLVRMNRRGHVTVLDSGNLPPGNLIFIAGDANTGWYVAHQAGSKITILHSAFLDHGDWKPIREESVAWGLWVGVNKFWIWHTKTGFGYAVSEGRIASFDYASQRWTERSAPNGDRFADVEHQADGTISALTSPGGGFAGIFASLYISEEGGEHWTKIESPVRIKATPVRRLRNGTLLLAGGAFGKPELLASTDGGATWSVRSTQVGPVWDDLVVLPTRGLLAIASGASGYATIRHSSDGGATWRVEYSNFDKAAYEASQKRR